MKRRRPKDVGVIGRKLSLLDLHHYFRDLTCNQPEQVSVACAVDGSDRVVLLTSPEAKQKSKILRRSLHPEELTPSVFEPSNFSLSRRYHCIPDPQGQMQGGVGFVYEGVDLAVGSKVAVKIFHKTEDAAALTRYHDELVAGLRLYSNLHSGYADDDLEHVVRLRDVVIDAPMFECKGETWRPTTYSVTAMVFEWVTGGDAHSFVSNHGSFSPSEGMRIFLQVAKGLRALHRRGIAHRDVKPENILLNIENRVAKVCDLGFAKHIPSTTAGNLSDDPTTCYQSPERWLASPQKDAVCMRRAWGAPRVDESVDNLTAGDAFSFGVVIFVLLCYDAIVRRMQSAPECQRLLCSGDRPVDPSVGVAGDEGGRGAMVAPVPPLNIFQHRRGGLEMFELLDAGVQMGGSQIRLWQYWRKFGVALPTNVELLLDGLLHPLPQLRWSVDQAIVWMEGHLELFEDEVRQ